MGASISLSMLKPYFKYDLGAEKFVKALVTIGRLDANASQSRDWIAYVGNDPTTFANNTQCIGGSAADGQEVTCNALGRYVIFEKQDTDFLTFHLVVIFEGCDCSSWTLP